MAFLRSVIQTLIQNGWEQLGRYTLVFPMQRAGLYAKMYIREELKHSGYDKPVVLPRMLTIDQLVDDLSPLRTTDEIRAVCRLYKIYQKHTRQGLTLDAFYGWGGQLLNDMSNIDMSLLDVGKVLEHVAAAQEFDNAGLDDETREHLRALLSISYTDDSIQNFFRELWDKLPAIFEDFKREEEEQGVGTKGACYRYVLEHIDELMDRLEGRTYVFVGFNYLLPAERALMKALKDKGQALFFWDDDPAFRTDESVYKFIHENITQFGNSYLPTPKNDVKDVMAIATMSANAQAQYVGKWLGEHHHQGERTAVVIADETMLESVLYTLPTALSGRVNITKGYPLKHTQIYADVIRYLNDSSHDRRPDEADFAGVIERLSHSLHRPDSLTKVESEGTLSEQEDSLTTGAWQDILMIEAYCQTQLVLSRFAALIHEGALSEVGELHTLRNLLRRCLDTITLPFHGEPVEEIQVIGVLETRLLDFDNVLILNVEEGVVPGGSTDRSFIPFDIRKAYHMQTKEEEAKVYAYNFFRLVRRAKEVCLLFSEASGDMSKKTMSRFVMQMLLSPDFRVTKRRITEGASVEDVAEIVPTKRWIETARCRRYSIPEQETPIEELTLSLSPSALTDYIECPREFYLKHIEKIAEVEGKSLILAPNELGSLFHGAIQHAYEVICCDGQKITKKTKVEKARVEQYLCNWAINSEDALIAGYQELVEHYNKYHKEGGETIYLKDEHKAENEVVKTMLRNVLESELKAPYDLYIRLLEGDYRRRLRVDGFEVPILVGGTIDRLDIIENGDWSYLRVLDYKTGSYQEEKLKANDLNTIFEKYESHYVLQTMLYCSVCNDWQSVLNKGRLPIMPQLLFTQKLSADKYVRIDGSIVSDFSQYKDEFDKQLKQTIGNILQDTTFDKCDSNTCGKSFCPFHILCGREKSDY